MGHYPRILLLLLILILVFPESQSWGWFTSSSETHSTEKNPSGTKTDAATGGFVAEFSMDASNNPKGAKLVESAKGKAVGSNSCWQNAYRALFAGCSKIFADEEKRSRFAWHLSDCFQKDSGRPSLPYCDTKADMISCRKKLDDDERKVYLEFYLETNSICHQLQSHAFKQETERLVNELKNSAQFAEDKLVIIEERSENVLQSSNQIYDSLLSVDHRTKLLAETTKKVEDRVEAVLKHSEAVYEQSRGIIASQSELREGQGRIKEKIEEGMSMLQDSYNNLGQEIDNLKNEAVEIEKEIGRVGDAMSSQMNNLQSKANDIGNMAGISLDKQRELLDGQQTALKGLQFLSKFQSEALEESRNTLQGFAEISRGQQEELLDRQEHLQRVHDHLMENSKSMLEAQEAFELKQASMFIALDKLFALHNAMLLESRLIKAFFIYSASIFIIYMLTSTKQTYTMRPRLYIGLFATFLIEFAILRLGTNQIEQQTWIINLIRSLFVLLASIQLLHAICTYRDYEVINHQMLLTLIEKVNDMQVKKELMWDMDSDVEWSSWIDKELPEDIDKLEDPDYMLPEGVGENSVIHTSNTRRYDLRQRRR